MVSEVSACVETLLRWQKDLRFVGLSGRRRARDSRRSFSKSLSLDLVRAWTSLRYGLNEGRSPLPQAPRANLSVCEGVMKASLLVRVPRDLEL